VISHEPSGQEVAHRHAQGLAVHRRHGDDDLGGGEFGQLLTTAAAGRHRLGAIGDDRHLGDPVSPAAIIAAIAPASAQVPSG
jgi:hypothetical protein